MCNDIAFSLDFSIKECIIYSMSKVVFELSDGVDGEIQLRDNAFMDFWKMVFTRNNKLLGPRQDVIIGNSMSRPIDDPIPAKRFIRQKNIRSSMKSAKEFHANCVAEVNKSIDDLEKAGWPWRHGKLNSESAWDDCNRIHRGFTTYFWSGVTDHLDIPFDKLIYLKTQHINFRAYESKFLIPWLDPTVDIPLGNHDPEHPRSWYSWDREIREPLHNINAYVHKLEDECLVSPRNAGIIDQWRRLNNKNYESLAMKNLDWNSKGKDQITDDIVCDWDFAGLLKVDGDICSSDPKYNVYDLKNILGKDYEKAYKDYDNPTNWDVTNTYNTTKGGFEIRPWQSYTTNWIIRPWVQTYGLPTDDRHIAPITLGHISEAWMEEHFFTQYSYETSTTRKMVKVDLI